MINASAYQRLIVAYHGCDLDLRDSVLSGKAALSTSKNSYDWLGHGIYFWEHGPSRAFEWAQIRKKRGKINRPAVLGAVLHLGQCFDLLDTEYTEVLRLAFPQFEIAMRSAGRAIPTNDAASELDPDRLLRRRDCAVVNWTIERLESEQATKFQTVRGVFQEGAEAFPDSAIKLRSHIQIAVREPSCIIGYFLPV